MPFTVDELRVNLVGDASGLMKMSAMAQDSIKQIERTAAEASKTLGGFAGTIKNVVTTAVGVFGALKVGDFFGAAVKSFKDMKDAQESLNSTIAEFAPASADIDALAESHKAFAKEMSVAAAVSERMVVSLLDQAEALEVTGDAAQKAVKGALGLSKLTGFDASGFIDPVSWLDFKGGDTKEMEKLFPALSEIKNQSERLAAAQKLVRLAFAESSKAAESWEGKLASMREAYESFKVKVGEVASTIADTARFATGAVWVGAAKGLAAVGETIKDVFGEAARYVNSEFGESLGGLNISWEGFKQAAVDAGNLVRLVFMNLDKVVGGTWEATSSLLVMSVSFIGDAARDAGKWVGDFASRNKEAIASVGLLAGAVGVGVLAYKGFTVALGATLAVASALKLQQVAGIALWVAWSGAVLVAKGAVLAYTAAVGAAGLGTTLWNAGLLAEKAALWLVNTALTATNLLTAGLGVVMAGVGIGAFVAGLGLAAAALKGVWEAGKAVVGVLSELELSSGPIGHIGGMFREWGGILKDVATAARTNMGHAWELLAAGAKLAVSQVADLFDPLWEFVTEGFGAAWDVASKTALYTFQNAVADMTAETLKFFKVFDLLPGNPFGPMLQAATQDLAQYRNEGQKLQADAVKAAQERFRAAQKAFSVDPSEMTQELLETVKKLRDAVPGLKPDAKGGWLQGLLKGAVDPAFLQREADQAADRLADMMVEGKRLTDQLRTPQEKMAAEQKRIGDLFKAGAIDADTYNRALQNLQRGVHGAASAFQRIEAVRAGSADDLFLLQSQAWAINDERLQQKNLQVKGGVPLAFDAAGNGQMGGKVITLLQQIRDTIDRKETVVLEVADIG